MTLKEVLSKLGNFRDVENMTSSNGNDVPNQFIIRFENGRVFKSYSSIIAVKVFDDKTYLTDHWDYSATTGRYRNDFLNCSIAECRSKIKSGQYQRIKGH